MAKRSNVVVDARLLTNTKFEQLAKTLKEADRYSTSLKGGLKGVAAELARVTREMNKYNTALQKSTKSSKSSIEGQARGLRAGSPGALLTNAATTGKVNRFEAEANQVFARLTNTYLRGLRNFTKAVQTQAVLSFAAGGVGAPSANLATLQQQRQAQQFRVSQLSQGMTTDASGRMRQQGRFVSKAQVEELNREKAILKQIEASHTNITRRQKESLSLENRILKVARDLRVEKVKGDQSARVGLLIKKQELTLQKQQVQAEGRITTQVKIAESRLRRLLMLKQRINNTTLSQVQLEKRAAEQVRLSTMRHQAEARSPALQQAKAENTRQGIGARLFGDGGAFLFKVQTQLMGNYLVINNIFRLFQFGRTFVLELDAAFHQLQAITATTNVEMEGLSKSLIKVSEGTKFTAVDVAKAATVLGQAGFSVSQIKDSISSITLFATAIGSDLTKAVDIVTSVLSVFNLQAAETGNVVNIMTSAINNSKLNLEKLTLGVQYAGNIAQQSGANFSELTTVIAAFANAGIRAGSTLGTGLRQLIVGLAKPTDKLKEAMEQVGLKMEDVDIRANGLIGVLKNLKAAGFGAGQAFNGLRVRAASAYLAISGQLGTIDTLQQKFLLSAAAIKANEIQMKSLQTTLSVFKGILGSFIVNVAEPFRDVFRGATESMGTMLKALNEIAPAISVVGTALISLGLGALTIRLGTMLAHLVGLGPALINLTARLIAARTAAVGFSAAMALGHPILLAATAIFTLIGAFYLFGRSSDDTAESLDKLQGSLDETVGLLEKKQETIEALDNKIDELGNRYASLNKDQGALAVVALELDAAFGELGAGIDLQATSVDTLIGSLRGLREEYIALTTIDIGLAIQKSQEMIDETLKASRENFGRSGVESFIDSMNSDERQGFFKKFGGGVTREGDITTGPSKRSGFQFATRGTKPGIIDPTIKAAVERLKSTRLLLAGGPEIGPDLTPSEIMDFLQETGNIIGDVNRLIRVEQSEIIQNSLKKLREQLVAGRGALQASLSQILGKQGLEDTQEVALFKNTPIYKNLKETVENLGQQLSNYKEFIRVEKPTTSQREDLRDALAADIRRFTKHYSEVVISTGTSAMAQASGLDADLSKVLATVTAYDEQLTTEINDVLSKVAKEQLKNFRSIMKKAGRAANKKSSYPELVAAMATALDAFDKETAILFQERGKDLESIRKEDPTLYARALDNFSTGRTADRGALVDKFMSIVEEIDEHLFDVKEHFVNFSKILSEISKTYKLAVDAAKAPLELLKAQLNVMSGLKFGGQFSELQREEIRRREIPRLEQEQTDAIVTAGKVDVSGKTATIGKIDEEIVERTRRIAELRVELQNYKTSAKELHQIDPGTKKELEEQQSRLIKLNEARKKATMELTDAQQTLNKAIEQQDLLLGKNLPEQLTLLESLRVAARQYVEDIGGMKSITATLADEFKGIFKSMQGAFTSFVKEVALGNKTIGQSFKDMAINVIEALLEIAAQKLAVEIFSTVMGFLGSPGASGAPDDIGTRTGGTGGFLSAAIGVIGGMFGMNGGGPVRAAAGMFTRDSKLALVRPGEYVLRNTAVEAVGRDNLDMINAMGNNVVSKSAPPAYQPAPRKGDTVNVWVVSPDQKPTLGPNDIVAVIADDIARGGSVKKLVKQVQLGTV